MSFPQKAEIRHCGLLWGRKAVRKKRTESTMGWEAPAAVILFGLLAAIRIFVRLFAVEYDSSLAARRAINTSRRRVAAKLRLKLERAQVESAQVSERA